MNIARIPFLLLAGVLPWATIPVTYWLGNAFGESNSRAQIVGATVPFLHPASVFLLFALFTLNIVINIAASRTQPWGLINFISVGLSCFAVLCVMVSIPAVIAME